MMSENTLDNIEKVEISAQTAGAEGASAFENVVNVQHVKEIVELSHEGDPQSGGASDETDANPAIYSWAGISDAVGKLIPTKKQIKPVVIPAQTTQKARLEKVFHKNIRKLSRQANGMLGNKHFSADQYEELVTQIRRFRAMLAQLLEVAAETLELWYKQYVLRVS